MISLIVNNSYSAIKGLPPEYDKKLREVLSYTVGGKSAWFSGYGPRKKSLLSKRGEFPTGLLSAILKYIAANKLETPAINDIRKIPSNRLDVKSSWTGITPYESQIAAASEAVIEERGIIAMPTGTGKSLVIALILDALKVKTLIVVPSLEIKRQLTEMLDDIFSDISWITVENIDSSKLKKADKYDCLIIDEAHHVAAKTYQKLNKKQWTGIYYRYFLTATPFRNDEEEKLLFEGIAGDIIYQLDYKTAVNEGYIVPVEAYYFEVPKQETDAYTWNEVYPQLVINNRIRNDMLSQLIKNLKQNAVHTLILVKEIRHGRLLAMKTGVPLISGDNEGSRGYIRQFNEGKIKVIIATEAMLGEGIDTKPCEYVIIAGLGKAKSAFMQKVGRAVRKYPGKESAKVIIFKDRSHKFMLSHFNAQKKILLSEYGINVVKLDL